MEKDTNAIDLIAVGLALGMLVLLVASFSVDKKPVTQQTDKPAVTVRTKPTVMPYTPIVVPSGFMP